MTKAKALLDAFLIVNATLAILIGSVALWAWLFSLVLKGGAT